MTSVSAVVLTRNEERHLPECLAGLQWADELLVLDSFSTDRTAAIAREAGARVEQRPFKNFAAQRDAALALAVGEWVLFVDADERVSPELREEIEGLVAERAAAVADYAGYWIPRKNYIFGAWVQYTGWYPDRQLRLMRRSGAHYDGVRPVHELVELNGKAGELSGHLIHVNYETAGEFVRKQKAYAVYAAQQLGAQGIRARPHHFMVQPLREFRRRYLTLQGYRDGWRGLLLSILMAWYTFEVYRVLAIESRKTGG